MKTQNLLRKIGFTRLTFFSALFLSSMVLGVNCSGFTPMDGGSGLENLSSSAGDVSLPISLLTSEQMLKTMLSVTGVQSAGELDGLIQKTYNERSGSLPSEKEIDQATGPAMIAVTNIASAVCLEAVANDRAVSESNRAQRLFFREMDFSKGLGAQDPNSVAMAFDRLSRNAWRRDARADEMSTIETFANEFAAGVDAVDPAQTNLLAVSICTAVLSSIDSLTY